MQVTLCNTPSPLHLEVPVLSLIPTHSILASLPIVSCWVEIPYCTQILDERGGWMKIMTVGVHSCVVQ